MLFQRQVFAYIWFMRLKDTPNSLHAWRQRPGWPPSLDPGLWFWSFSGVEGSWHGCSIKERSCIFKCESCFLSSSGILAPPVKSVLSVANEGISFSETSWEVSNSRSYGCRLWSMGELEGEPSCCGWSVLFVFLWRNLFCRCKVPAPYEPISQFKIRSSLTNFGAWFHWTKRIVAWLACLSTDQALRKLPVANSM